ncbi:calcium/sodium antiporter [Novosphingobium sp. JCM 18896]|uniref:calcium/sodium antiporter n=1 Tax=Novosphingobium sp. JCM 18896 TaxID=2989731 RepID=UPI00222393ED|nr:calcium/sodium antiporter [Novosphingobium sp. JCM 18896]MCW1431889.1 calcium/sodium antiporter [Novosphingobium sp. JCM 18896]
MLIFSFFGGLFLLIVGGELLTRSAVRLAEGLRLSPLLISLTVVAFGTSAPELATSVDAVLLGSPDIAIANVVGSTLINSLVILGIAALIRRLPVEPSMLTRDASWMVAGTLLLLLLVWDGWLERTSGALLFLLLVGYIAMAYRAGSNRRRIVDHAVGPGRVPATGGFGHDLDLLVAKLGWILASCVFAVGLGLLVLGGIIFVEAAIDIAGMFGASETVIGLTIVAGGTSAPELVTSAIAAYRGRTDVAIGNVLGSNIYNMLGVTGIVGLVAPASIDPDIATLDLPATVVATVLVVLVMASGRQVSRIEGAILLSAYALFLWLHLT